MSKIVVMPYQGSKSPIADWIFDNMPSGYRCLVDVCGGGGSVSVNAIARKMFKVVVYNDLNGDIPNFFRVLRDAPDVLIPKLELTPCSRDEFFGAIDFLADKANDDPIERARCFFVRQVQVMKAFQNEPYWRMSSECDYASFWNKYPARLLNIAGLIKEMVIENRDAVRLIADYDSPSTLFYVDPPYLKEHAVSKYDTDMDEAAHAKLGAALSKIEGNALVSGYASSKYDAIYAGWKRVENNYATSLASGEASARVECLWIKNAGHEKQRDMFA
ncbi:MAG: DNA adenine methylase [Gammaproteobacteria bacterium AqS3]|nr:DNA adenine methylase [Gammaproteobacteria bacterium AqS3]